MKRRSFLTSTTLAAAALGLGLPAMAQEPLKVGFIYVGPVGDMGWSYQHDQGRKAIEEAYGDKVVTSYVESVPEGPDAERVLTQMALEGNKLIFATSFGFMDSVMNVAAKFPDVKFEHATGYKRADNVATYDARFYEGRAVQGTIAGRMTKSNKIGYIGSFPIPEVVQGINSAFIHARKVNPAVEMKVVWAYTWFDPAKEADAAAALIAEGVDVVLQHTDSTAPQAKAKEAGIYSFGQASDMEAFAPAPRISSIIDNWAPYYVERVGLMLDGKWASSATWGGIGAGEVQIGEISEAVPAEVKAEAEALRDAIAKGDYHPFTGPLNKQDGSVWLAEGEVADDATLSGLNFYVEGITAELPK
ncbi:BMP family ABC transporter substrate-binding protein [Rhodobacter veldkampii DSM 11550]|uniref:BMP family ABC transporter substrate-binding protein n=1 Tax=Phaeovulum veldkampii DSM 11550 TaxID=1185920 RepID=A0A2T4JI42_9RHOB|nr:BMP family ABC transporter substrate-binding protein [Phaeovulum veldkampii]MBK5947347.1 BMP family ABC transporter substrate-binding protein [Phaeovulum veldkampii DSM 11550]NCU20553.1 BMP family ABC transporter substrate-binding protein [Candidatus Falkowbacteria bacterium]PTE17576.1 BMP family ABC transporter substrate-binding protein [Phaeovulum veldkampii DSM 11550]TDQ60257.1 nucleoside-binding protein [Phaeovulum veldkampii DSM 11550]